MPTDIHVSRRTFLAGCAGLIAAPRLAARANSGDVPLVTRRVEKLWRNPAITQPNDLQFVEGGLWVLDQVDPNKAFLVKPEDGSIIRELQTRSIHGSGITFGNGALWITSTKMTDPKDPPRTLKVDPMTGATLKSWVTPGSGYYGRVTAERGSPSGAHGIKWVDGKYWMAVPAASKIFLMEPETGAIIRSIPGPGTTQRTHGLAWDKGALWCINSDDWAIYKLDPKDGTPTAKIQLARTEPQLHGLDIDAAGNLVSFSGASAQLYVYSGCNPRCKLAGGPFSMGGTSAYGHLNRTRDKLAVADYQHGQVDLYTYTPTVVNYVGSFNTGLSQTLDVVGVTYAPH